MSSGSVSFTMRNLAQLPGPLSNSLSEMLFLRSSALSRVILRKNGRGSHSPSKHLSDSSTFAVS